MSEELCKCDVLSTGHCSGWNSHVRATSHLHTADFGTFSWRPSKWTRLCLFRLQLILHNYSLPRLRLSTNTFGKGRPSFPVSINVFEIDNLSQALGPFTSLKKVMNVFDKLEFTGGRGEDHSSGHEGNNKYLLPGPLFKYLFNLFRNCPSSANIWQTENDEV